MMTFRFSANNTLDSKQSNTWANIITYATQMAKLNPSLVVTIRDYSMPEGLTLMSSFIWDSEKNDIIPA